MIRVSDVAHWHPRGSEGEETAAAQQGLGRESGPNPSQGQCTGSAARVPVQQSFRWRVGSESSSHCTGKPEFPAARRARAKYGPGQSR